MASELLNDKATGQAYRQKKYNETNDQKQSKLRNDGSNIKPLGNTKPRLALLGKTIQRILITKVS